MSMKQQIAVDKFLIEESLRDSSEAEFVTAKYPRLEWIPDYEEFPVPYLRGEERSVSLARKRGLWLKQLHCYHQNPEYPYYSRHVAEGCFFACVYCYLHGYLNRQSLVLFLDDANQ